MSDLTTFYSIVLTSSATADLTFCQFPSSNFPGLTTVLLLIILELFLFILLLTSNERRSLSDTNQFWHQLNVPGLNSILTLTTEVSIRLLRFKGSVLQDSIHKNQVPKFTHTSVHLSNLTTKYEAVSTTHAPQFNNLLERPQNSGEYFLLLVYYKE